MDNYIVAFDFGTESVSVAMGLTDNSQSLGFSVVYQETVPSKGIKRGSIVNVSEVQAMLTPLLDNVKRRIKRQSNYVIVANVSGLTFNYNEVRKTVDIPNNEIDAALIANVADKAQCSASIGLNEEIVRFLEMGFSLDSGSFVTSVLGLTGSRLEARYLACIVRKEAIEVINKSLSRFSLGKVYTSASAKGAVYLNSEDKKNIVALVDLGAGTTNVGIFSNGVLAFESSLPFGSDTITNDIARGMEVSRKQAAILKHFLGLRAKEISQEKYDAKRYVTIECDGEEFKADIDKFDFIVRSRVQEIASYVGSMLMKSRLNNSISYIMLVGGGAELKGIESVFEESLMHPVKIPQLPHSLNDVTPTIAGALGMITLYLRENRVVEEPTIFDNVKSPEVGSVKLPDDNTASVAEQKAVTEEDNRQKKGKLSSFLDKFTKIMDDGPSLGEEKVD